MDFFRENIVLGEVVVQLLAFVIVFLTLKHFAWKPVLRALDARRDRIKNDFDRIDQARREIEALRSEYTTHLQKIEEESRARMQEAIEEGRRIARDIQSKARSESQAAFDKAKENLALETEKVRIVLRREIADLAVRISEKVLEEELDSEDQRKKLLDMINKIEKKL